MARACAGGVAVDGVHDFEIEGTLRYVEDDSIATGKELKLSFEGNKGHDYSNDPPGIKPTGWTTDQIKRAKFITTGQSSLVEEMTVNTNSEGKFNIHVLSSDIISDDIKIKIKWTDENDEEKDVGEKACDFEEAIGRRGFPDQHDSNNTTDDGWLFNKAWLNYPGSETTAKVYLQYQKGSTVGWNRVNGHRIKFEVGKVDLNQGGQGSPIGDYANVINTDDPDQPYVIHTTRFDGALDGAATVMIKAGEKINQADTIWVYGTDLSQWDN